MFAVTWWEGVENMEPTSSQMYTVTGKKATRHKVGLEKFQIELKGKKLHNKVVKHWNEYPQTLQDFHPQRY